MQKIEFDDEPLLQEYQYALLCTLKDPQRELNNACRIVGERFGGKDIKIRDMKEFASQFTAFLKDYLKMAEGVSVEYNDENHVLSIHIEGCKFCPANTLFKLEKNQSAVCPLGGLLRGALEHVDGKIKSFRWDKHRKTSKSHWNLHNNVRSYHRVSNFPLKHTLRIFRDSLF